MALLVTLNYYGLAFSLVGRIAPTLSPRLRECISFISVYMLSFVFLLYFCLWLCAETLKIHNVVDAVGGGTFGILGGIVCSGVLMMFWFSMPFATRDFPIDDAEMFYPPHKLTLHMASFFGSRIEGDRPFDGRRFLRDLRYGLPGILELGEGIYVASVPNGMRVVVGGGDPKGFAETVAKFLGRTEAQIRPSERKDIGLEARTPTFVEGAGGGDNEVLIAVVNDLIPNGGNDEFAADGAVGVSKKKDGERTIVIRVYSVSREGNVGSLIASFQPKDPSEWHEENKDWAGVRALMPTRPCFSFGEKEAIDEMINHGATDDEARRIVPLLRLGGKACFKGIGDKIVAAEVKPGGKIEVFEPEEPLDLDASPEDDRRRR